MKKNMQNIIYGLAMGLLLFCMIIYIQKIQKEDYDPVDDRSNVKRRDVITTGYIGNRRCCLGMDGQYSSSSSNANIARILYEPTYSYATAKYCLEGC